MRCKQVGEALSMTLRRIRLLVGTRREILKRRGDLADLLFRDPKVGAGILRTGESGTLEEDHDKTSGLILSLKMDHRNQNQWYSGVASISEFKKCIICIHIWD